MRFKNGDKVKPIILDGSVPWDSTWKKALKESDCHFIVQTASPEMYGLIPKFKNKEMESTYIKIYNHSTKPINCFCHTVDFNLQYLERKKLLIKDFIDLK